MPISNQTALAKVRTIYGKMLKEEEYKNMLNCNTLKEVVDFLKNKDLYKHSFEILEKSNVETNQIEKLIKNTTLLNYSRIHRLIKKNEVLKYFIKYYEIDEILNITQLVEEKQVQQYMTHLPTYISLNCKVDLFSFSNVKNFEDLINNLKNTKYGKMLSNFTEKKLDFLELEHILYKNFFKELLKTINSKTKNVELYELNRLIKTKIDNINAYYIYRERVIFETEKEKIKNKIFPFHKNLNKEKIEKILDSQDTSQMEENFKSMYKKIDSFKIDTMEKNIKQQEFNLCKHYINLSTNITTVFYCYFILQQIEVENLIHILEGIRYNLEKEEIESFLIF